jgi:hypothetical protein
VQVEELEQALAAGDAEHVGDALIAAGWGAGILWVAGGANLEVVGDRDDPPDEVWRRR